jgi:hypothetical protein
LLGRVIDVAWASVEHQLSCLLAQAMVDAGGARVTRVDEHDGAGRDRGDHVPVAFDAARAGVSPLARWLFGAVAAQAVLRQRGGERRRLGEGVAGGALLGRAGEEPKPGEAPCPHRARRGPEEGLADATANTAAGTTNNHAARAVAYPGNLRLAHLRINS